MSTLNIKTTIIISLITGLISLYSCSKDSSNSTTEKGSLTIEFEATANDSKMAFNTDYTNTSNSEKMNFSLFQYYVSNIVLVKTDGTSYVVPKSESYFLVQHSGTENPEIELKNIPVGDYKSVSFIVGVDSVTNLADPASLPASLDPAKGMHWSWSQGYIFLKAEGKVNTSSDFKYHIGLNSNLKTITLTSSTESATVRTNIAPQIHLAVDVMKMFGGISVVANPVAMSGDKLTAPANNFSKMFSLEHIHN